MSNDVLKSLLDVAEGIAKKTLMYGRTSSFLSAVEAVLLVPAALAAVVYVLSHAAYWQPAVAGAALVAAAIVADKAERLLLPQSAQRAGQVRDACIHDGAVCRIC